MQSQPTDVKLTEEEESMSPKDQIILGMEEEEEREEELCYSFLSLCRCCRSDEEAEK